MYNKNSRRPFESYGSLKKFKRLHLVREWTLLGNRKTRSQKMPIKRAESHLSSAGCVGRRALRGYHRQGSNDT